jgi:hypothetical protein
MGNLCSYAKHWLRDEQRVGHLDCDLSTKFRMAFRVPQVNHS